MAGTMNISAIAMYRKCFRTSTFSLNYESTSETRLEAVLLFVVMVVLPESIILSCANLQQAFEPQQLTESLKP